ncbi:hypothetical protein AB0A71_38240 [Kitasatospora aureofaciens]|uniref:hypothetical protein n=1 Tax=Kitasatospora aureofaciens TaxID=1894 RepID=UPI0033D47B1A
MSTGSANEVVLAACDALATGLDGPALRALAACEKAEVDRELLNLLPAALEEQGLTYYTFGSDEASEAGVRLLASRMLDGRLTPVNWPLKSSSGSGMTWSWLVACHRSTTSTTSSG